MTDKERIKAYVIRNENGFYFTGDYNGDMWDDEIHRALFVQDEPTINMIRSGIKDEIANDLRLDIIQITIQEGDSNEDKEIRLNELAMFESWIRHCEVTRKSVLDCINNRRKQLLGEK